ncbi:efflux RND transporter periplasmic adaptor subunit [Lacisediminihabitans sp. FW035]
MGIARKWVFPIIRIIIFLAIAAALVKMAFFSGAITATDPTVPTAQIEEPIATVEIGTITNDVTLPATVSADAAVPVKATLAGEVKKVLVAPGQAVVAATPLLTIRSEVPSADGTSVAIKTVTITAGSVGILSSFPVIVGQVVAVGDVVGQVAPPTFSVSGSLSPEQQYRLLNRPTEATVAITGGPAPFTCTGLTITSALAGASADSSSTSDAGSGGSSSSGTTIRCAVPAGVTVFSGLAAKLTISGGVAKDVLVVPITAVEGSAQTGVVYTQKADGSTEKHPVTIGLTDGTNVEITGGLAKGDLILQFVPGATAKPDCANPRFAGTPECQGVGG